MKKKNCKLTGILRAIALPLVGSAGGWHRAGNALERGTGGL